LARGKGGKKLSNPSLIKREKKIMEEKRNVEQEKKKEKYVGGEINHDQKKFKFVSEKVDESHQWAA